MSRINLPLLTSLLLTSLTTFALPTEPKQPYKITAESAIFNNNKHFTIFEGKVVGIQGQSKILADKLVLYLDEKNQRIVEIVATGKPATYSIAEKKQIITKAGTITYYPDNGEVILQKKASIRQNLNVIQGPYITYNVKTQTIKSNANKRHKTTIILQPQDLAH